MLKIIGKREPRVDALGKVTGAAKYADDYNLPHQLYGAVKYAGHAHARIVQIDTHKAEALSGVEAIMLAKDIPGQNRFGLLSDMPVIADDKVRYLGDVVAIVAARDKQTAARAAELIDVTYEELPALFDPEEALQEGASKIHEEGNQIVHHKVRKGDIETGFSEADFIIEKTFGTQFIEHAYIEPEAALAAPDEQDGLQVIGSMQNFYTSHKVIAGALGLPLNKVQIIQSTLGGSFGGKDESATMLAARAALLAQKTGKAVKILNSREDSIRQSYKRHPYKLYYKWGCKQDGSITAMQIKAVADGGAYASMSPFVTWRSVVQATGPYHCPHVQTDIFAAYTNNNYTGAMRGFGSPQVNFAIESMMDELAEKTGKTPLEIRLQNAFEDGALTATGQKLKHKVSLKEVLQKAAATADFENKWRQNRSGQQSAVRRGIGLSCAYRGVSLGAEGVDAASAVVYVQPDGSVTVSAGIIDMGQGAQTAMSQIVAEVLGLKMQRLRFLIPDTGRVADSGPTVASRGTIMGGGAAKIAAENVRALMLKTAAELYGVSQEQIEFADETVWLNEKSNKKALCTFDELVNACYARGRALFSSGVRHIAETSWDEEDGHGDAYFTFVYGANIAEVEVDTETGKVDVVRFFSAHDVGRAINRSTVEGQIYGGVAMGVGYGVLEEFIQEQGQAKTLNFDEYYIPTSLDVPQMQAIIIENPDEKGPFGAKSIGEPAVEMAAPAVANAIYNATGRRIYNLPANLEEVLLGKKLRRDVPRSSVSCKTAAPQSKKKIVKTNQINLK